MSEDLRPSKAEENFLTLAYNRFYGIFDEVMDDTFWDKEELLRFSKIKDGFAIYSEILNYPPVKWVIEHVTAANKTNGVNNNKNDRKNREKLSM